MNSRKYPRTMTEAFGPYTSNEIEEKADYAASWWAALICCAMGALIVIGVTL
jgi:hypothetical protein